MKTSFPPDTPYDNHDDELTLTERKEQATAAQELGEQIVNLSARQLRYVPSRGTAGGHSRGPAPNAPWLSNAAIAVYRQNHARRRSRPPGARSRRCALIQTVHVASASTGTTMGRTSGAWPRCDC